MAIINKLNGETLEKLTDNLNKEFKTCGKDIRCNIAYHLSDGIEIVLMTRRTLKRDVYPQDILAEVEDMYKKLTGHIDLDVTKYE